MLICLVLCAAAVLPTALSETPEAPNVQQHAARNNEMARRLAASYADARNQGLLRLPKYEDQAADINEDATPSFSNIYAFFEKNPSLLLAFDPESEDESPGNNGFTTRALDQIGGGRLLRRAAILDTIGGGHLLKKNDGLRALDPLGGGHLLKRDFQMRQLDSIGGGHLLKRAPLDSIGGGHLLKRAPLDSIGGGHLLKRAPLDSIGGGHLLKRYLDPLGGGHLLKRGSERRQLDAIGGGHLLKRTIIDDMKEFNSESDVNEPTIL